MSPSAFFEIPSKPLPLLHSLSVNHLCVGTFPLYWEGASLRRLTDFIFPFRHSKQLFEFFTTSCCLQIYVLIQFKCCITDSLVDCLPYFTFAISLCLINCPVCLWEFSVADWVLIYLYIGITLSDYKVPYRKHFCKME